MFGVLIALLATTAFLSPPSPSPAPTEPQASARQVDPMIQSVGERQAARRTDEEDEAARATRLEKLWIPLPCTRVGNRMVC